jgi:serine/threonine protein kinase
VFLVREKETDQIYAMKALKKKQILELDEKEHILTEKEIIETIDHPFIVKLHYAFQTDDKLYFVFDFINGGELYFHLANEGK